MATRLVLAVLSFFSSFLLFLFSSLMKRRSVTFSVICVKHNWDPDEKASSMRVAAFMYLIAGCAALFGELVWGWALRTPTGISACRTWSRFYHKVYRFILGRPVGSQQLKSSDNSEEDDDFELMTSSGFGRRNPGVGSAAMGNGNNNNGAGTSAAASTNNNSGNNSREHSRTSSLGARRPVNMVPSADPF